VHPANSPFQRSRANETGAITILVTLMLLVLLTVWAISMSKNALREVMITGTSRQGAQVRNASTAGIDWAVFWLMDDLTKTRSNPTAGAISLRDQKSTFVTTMQTGVLSGVISNAADMTLPAPGANSTLSFQLYLTYMGNPRLPFTQQDVRATSISAATAGTVQLWAVRSDGILNYTSGPTFVNRQEAWFTLPPTAQK
jgi:hypothetical protein